MPGTINLPLFKDLVPAGFTFGGSYLVEFEPHSLWYEVSLTLAAQGLNAGNKVDYHTFLHTPQEVRAALGRLHTQVKALEEKETFRVMDSFTVTTGLASALAPSSREPFQSKSLDLNDWAKGALHESKEGAPEIERQRLHIDDNLSVLAQYNDEKSLIDYWRTKFLPHTRALELAVFHSLAVGIHSEVFYRQFEALCDGIIDIKAQEEDGVIRHYVRVRTFRGSLHESQWRKVTLLETGGVVLSATPGNKTLGIRGWMKGPKQHES